MEKLAYTIVISSRKLRPYFWAYHILVLIDHPLRQVLQKLEALDRLIGYRAELIRDCVAIKGQALVDFIVEFITQPEEMVGEELANVEKWDLYLDGFSNNSRVGVGLMLISLEA